MKTSVQNPEAYSKKLTFTYPDGSTRDFPPGITIGEAILPFPVSYPVVAAYLNYKIYPLDREPKQGGLIEPVHLGHRDGALIYRRSLTFVLVRAAQEIYPDLRVYINHSLSGGHFVKLYSDKLQSTHPLIVQQEDLDKIKARMDEIIEADEPFVRTEVPLEESIQYFKKTGRSKKASALQWCRSARVALYTCGGATNHFYGYLAPSTGYLKVFGLRLKSPGFILCLPSVSNPLELPPYEPQEKLFRVYQEYDRWMRILGLDTIAQLNCLIASKQIREYILIAEGLQEKKIAQIADLITHNKNHPRVVLTAGPSASGKTTFGKRLSIQLRVNGYRPVLISMDHFFVNREKTPRDEFGEYDFEAFGAIDSKLFDKTVVRLLSGKKVAIPKFNFSKGRSEPGETLQITPDQILLIEGIHGLNDRLLSQLPEGWKFRIYVSPLTRLNIDEHNRIQSSDIRLLRRIVRDSRYRGYSAAETIARWPSVSRGEEVNIYPYQERADVIFNSALPYELGVLVSFAKKGLEAVKRESSEFAEAVRLLRFLSYILEIPADEVPGHSLLREFIGGSRFRYS